MQTITPFLWFDKNAEEAVNFYLSVFKNARILTSTRYGDEGAKVSGMPKGTVMTIQFELNGLPFTALNGGPLYKFNEAISFIVNCENQKEIDAVWDAFSKEGTPIQCGWIKDKYGVTWQVVPKNIAKYFTGKDPKQLARVQKTLFAMQKLDIAQLEKAFKG